MSDKMVNLSDWKVLAKSNQENFSNQLGDRIWDEFIITNDTEKMKYIFQKIAIPLTGPPRSDADDLGLNDNEKAIVNDIKEKLINHSFSRTKLRIAVIFVFVYINKKSQTMVPLYRVMQTDNKDVSHVPNSIFIDHTGRVYESLEKYSDNNTWDKCWLCIPKNGYYKRDVDAIFWDQSARGNVKEVVDQVSTVTSITTSCFMIAGTVMTFIPVTAPLGAATVIASSIVGAPAAVYGVGRSVGTIVDRMWHEQSVSLADAEARQCWLVTGACILSLGTMGSAQLLASSARAGTVASSTVRVLCTALNVTSVSMSGLGVLNMCYEVARKDKVTPLDVFQLSTSIFFFTHSVISFQTASTIIKNAQQDEINLMRSALRPEDQNKHDAFVQASRERPEYGGKTRVMHGNAEFIKEMKQISNVNEFYSHFQIVTDNQMSLNNELTIHPRAFLQMSEADRTKMMNLSKQLNNNEITLKDFNAQTRSIQREFRFRLDRHRADANNYLQEKFNVGNVKDIKVGQTNLAEARPHEIDRLEGVVKSSLHNGDPDYLRVADAMADKAGATSVSEYCSAGEYVARHVEQEVKARQQANPNPPREQGIKAKDFYKKQVVNDLLQNDGAKLNEVNQKFNELRVQTDAANASGNPRFGNSMAAANHYDKHPYFPKYNEANNLSPREYFNIAREMAGGPIRDIKWTQDGSSLKCTFYSDKYGATSITYTNVANNTTVIATLMAEDSATTETRYYEATRPF